MQLSRYRVLSAHNAFIPNYLQLCTCGSTDIISDLLHRNYRSLEIDIHEVSPKLCGGKSKMVLHGNTNWKCSTPVSVTSVLTTIRGFVDSHPRCSPVQIFIQNEMKSPEVMDMFINLAKTILGDILVCRIDPDKYMMEDLRGQVLLVDTSPTPNAYEPYRHILAYTLQNNQPIDSVRQPEKQQQQQQGIRRVYVRNTIFSTNQPFDAAWNANIQVIAMNAQMANNKYVRQMEERFSSANNSQIEGYLPIIQF